MRQFTINTLYRALSATLSLSVFNAILTVIKIIGGAHG
jgi:hypothetical protein